jgi:hypothetical protein
MIRITIAVLLTLTALGVSAYCAMQPEPPVPLPTPPVDPNARPAEKKEAPPVAVKPFKAGTKVLPDNLSHDFGIVPYGTRATHTFRFTNTSDVPLRIVSLRAS